VPAAKTCSSRKRKSEPCCQPLAGGRAQPIEEHAVHALGQRDERVPLEPGVRGVDQRGHEVIVEARRVEAEDPPGEEVRDIAEHELLRVEEGGKVERIREEGPRPTREEHGERAAMALHAAVDEGVGVAAELDRRAHPWEAVRHGGGWAGVGAGR